MKQDEYHQKRLIIGIMCKNNSRLQMSKINNASVSSQSVINKPV